MNSCKRIGCQFDALPGSDFCASHFMSHGPVAVTAELSTEKETHGKEDEYTGGPVSYYKVPISAPISGGKPYTAECGDIIEALNMDFNEGNAFKAMWRRCAARSLDIKKKGYDDGYYDAEKAAYYSERVLAKSSLEREIKD